MKTTFNWSKVDKSRLLGRVVLAFLDGFCMVGSVLAIDLMIRQEELTVFRGVIQVVASIMWLCFLVREVRRIARFFKDAHSYDAAC